MTNANALTAATRTMIMEWVGTDYSDRQIESVARYMRDSLRVGGITICRQWVKEAIAGTEGR